MTEANSCRALLLFVLLVMFLLWCFVIWLVVVSEKKGLLALQAFLLSGSFLLLFGADKWADIITKENEVLVSTGYWVILSAYSLLLLSLDRRAVTRERFLAGICGLLTVALGIVIFLVGYYLSRHGDV